jgi:hypothetical protein
MIRPRGTLSPEIRALLDEERAIPAQPAAVRARAVARARAAMAAGVATPVRPVLRTRASLPARWAAAILLACMASAAVGAVAYGVRAHLARAEEPIAAPPAPRVVVTITRSTNPPAIVVPIDEAPPVRPRVIPPPRLSPADAVRQELRLLRPARAAVARGDFVAALSPIAEHAHRFKDGRLSEEREALRVKALFGLGRNDEALRAATSFRAHFPHSVLLPAVGQMAAAGR